MNWGPTLSIGICRKTTYRVPYILVPYVHIAVPYYLPYIYSGTMHCVLYTVYRATTLYFYWHALVPSGIIWHQLVLSVGVPKYLWAVYGRFCHFALCNLLLQLTKKYFLTALFHTCNATRAGVKLIQQGVWVLLVTVCNPLAGDEQVVEEVCGVLGQAGAFIHSVQQDPSVHLHHLLFPSKTS